MRKANPVNMMRDFMQIILAIGDAQGLYDLVSKDIWILISRLVKN